MSRQLVIVDSVGGIRGLDHKRKGLDLKQFGVSLVRRETLIEWENSKMGWYIRWYNQKESKVWGLEEFKILEEELRTVLRTSNYVSSQMILFSDYEDAVNAEIAVIQRLQRSGAM